MQTGPYSAHVTINETGWDPSIEEPPPVFYISDSFLQLVEKTGNLTYATVENISNYHLLNNYATISTSVMHGDMNYLSVPLFKAGDILGMSMGITVCSYEYIPATEIYPPNYRSVKLKVYHKVLYKDKLMWIQFNAEAVTVRAKSFNDKICSAILNADVRF